MGGGLRGEIECYWMANFYSYRLINTKDEFSPCHSPSTAQVLIYNGYILIGFRGRDEGNHQAPIDKEFYSTINKGSTLRLFIA